MLLSILMPVYNESATLVQILERVFDAPWPVDIEVVAVNDASSDRSGDLLAELQTRWQHLTVLHHTTNRGKGAAIRTALASARGDVIAIQDADLEYDPADLARLVEPVIWGRADVVYGSRFLTPSKSLRANRLANKCLTMLSNVFTGQHLTDMETCYKVIRRKCLENIRLRSNRFGVEPELTAKLARRGVRIREWPISYSYRTHAEGKKISLYDGIKALAAIVYFSLAD